MRKVDLKKNLKHLYNPSAREVSEADVPPMTFLIIDGKGAPNTSQQRLVAMELELEEKLIRHEQNLRTFLERLRL